MSRMVFLCLPLFAIAILADDSLPPITAENVPHDLEELWDGYDPRAEPLDVTIVHQWERIYEGRAMTVQMLTYSIGTFKGVESRMGAYYAYPTDLKGQLPGILQMHGGGQRAMPETVMAAAANGYACLAINWGGKRMQDQQDSDPGTDWGAVDATQTGHNSHYASLQPDDKTLDSVVSPRNNNWFLIVLAARRGLTLLEQRPKVDALRLGAEGHSMGGRLTVLLTGIDHRVKVAVPSCGGTAAAPPKLLARPGSSTRPRNPEPLYYRTIDEINSIRRIRCPVLYLGPQNDFNGNLDNLYANWREMPSDQVHFSISPHLNHRHIPEANFAGLHFFNVQLQGEGYFPNSPELKVSLDRPDGVPTATVHPDRPGEAAKVEVYYSDNPHALTRFWRTAKVTRSGDQWLATCPLLSLDRPLFVMANVSYPLPKTLVGPPWNRRSPETFLISSWAQDIEPAALVAAGARVTSMPQSMIVESFDDWEDWYRLEWGNADHRQAGTRKLNDPAWRGPDDARLAIDVRDPAGGELALEVQVNDWDAYRGVKKSSYYATKPIAASEQWQTLEFSFPDFVALDEQSPAQLQTWRYITELRLVAKVRTNRGGQAVELGGSRWTDTRQLRQLRWIQP